MKNVCILLEALLLIPCLALKDKITPTQQVLNMMEELKAKGEKMMEEEQKTYATYAEWVDDRSKELGFEIKEGASKIEELTAFITKADSDVSTLGDEIADLEAEIRKHEAEKKAAIANRAEENAEYLKISQDYGESVDALSRAIQVVSSQNYDRAQAESLLQRMSRTTAGMSRVMTAFAQERTRSALRGDGGAPAVAAYATQSSGIVDLLEKLHKKFKAELADVEEAEAQQRHEFNLVELHLTDTVAKDSSDRDEKAVIKGKKASASAKAKGELAQTKAEKAADENLSAEIKSTFQAKTTAYEENQKVRKEELEALAKAIEIIAGGDVSGSYSKHINLAQSGRAPSLVQLSRSGHRSQVQEAASLLNQRAKSLHSRTLASVAQQIATNPFAKVIGMIESMLAKLKEQAAAEKAHKEWCDEQLKANKLKRNKKTAKINMLSADIEDMTATSAQMGQTMAKLSKEQAELTKAMSEATEQREKEKADNLETIADSAAAIDAVSKALVILKDFYSSQSGGSFLQQVPEMASYKGMQSSKGGVIGMLEVIESDFARLKADTESAEKMAAEEYDSFMKASQDSKKAKHDEEFQLKLDKDQVNFENGRAKKERRGVEAELAKANKYYDYLKPTCVEVKVNWEERAAKRQEEIDALKEAYGVLDRKSKE